MHLEKGHADSKGHNLERVRELGMVGQQRRRKVHHGARGQPKEEHDERAVEHRHADEAAGVDQRGLLDHELERVEVRVGGVTKKL